MAGTYSPLNGSEAAVVCEEPVRQAWGFSVVRSHLILSENRTTAPGLCPHFGCADHVCEVVHLRATQKCI